MLRLDIKKTAALGCAAAMALSLTGCGKNATWGADIDGVRIPAGVFIYYLDEAHYNAQDKLGKENQGADADDGSGMTAETAQTTPLYQSQIEGVPAKQWVYDEATRMMREYAAVDAKFSEYGLSFTDDEKASAKVSADSFWDFVGQYYEGMGISRKSYDSVSVSGQKRNKLFEHLYSEGGEKGVPDSDIKSYLDENYAMINYIDIELKDGEGNLLKSDGKEERRKMAEEYVRRYKEGDDFDILNLEYTVFYDDLKAAAEAKASEETAETEAVADMELGSADVETSPAQAPITNDEDVLTGDGGDENNNGDEQNGGGEESSDDNGSADTAENENLPESSEPDPEKESDVSETESAEAPGTEESEIDVNEEMPGEFESTGLESNKTVIQKSDSTLPDPAVAEKVFGDMKKGDIEIIESRDGEHYFVVVKLDILETDEYFESAKSSLLYEMKSEDFTALIGEWTSLQNFAKNQAAYDRYDPEKMFGKED